jgi:ubiquinone/menaquinone biosynthesis C-methylase UbiE
MSVDYGGRMASVYQAGRSLSTSVLSAWADAAARHLDSEATGIVCDLGSGTGRFSGALAARLDRPVVAIEPAAKMRDQAHTLAHPAVSIVAGRAEQVPVRASVFSLVWMSQSIHHVRDLEGCARELDRILAENGRVILRGLFDMDEWVLGPFFPGAAANTRRHFASLGDITDAFEHVGFHRSAHEQISQTLTETANELVERTRLRADSSLELLSDDDFERGLTRLADAVKRGDLPEPVIETLDLVVFAR